MGLSHESGPLIIFWEIISLTVWVALRVSVSVRDNYFMDSFSVLIRAQQFSMLTVRHCNHTLYWLLGLILYHTAGCDR